MIVYWQPEAEADLNAAIDYLRQFNPGAARRLLNKLLLAADSLDCFPERGRALMPADIRELVVPPYVLVYRISRSDDRVDILRLWHGAQDR